jgi:hypothetical protein
MLSVFLVLALYMSRSVDGILISEKCNQTMIYCVLALYNGHIYEMIKRRIS